MKKNIKQYEPPYTLEQIRAKYPEKVYKELASCPIHRWRAVTGIELIHKEPTIEELKRIWNNWQLMSDEEKKISDQRSIQLFGMVNETHYLTLIDEYDPFASTTDIIHFLFFDEELKIIGYNGKFRNRWPAGS